MAVRFGVAFDCADADRLTPFWCAALGYVLKPPPAGFDSWRTFYRSIGVPEEELIGSCNIGIMDPDGLGPTLGFLEVPEGKVVKNRVHLDLNISDGRGAPMKLRKEQVNAKADRLIELGATKLRLSDEEVDDHYYVVMQDPEGNEFCLR